MTNKLSFRQFALLLLAAIVVLMAWRSPIDNSARVQVREDLARAATVFAAARAIGSGLSVIQSANVDAKLFGTGVGFSPGQALRPVQEFVDQFATLMLAVSVAFGIQLLLLEIGAHWLVSGLLSVALVAAALALWRKDASPNRPWQALVVLLLMLRFAVPLGVAANGMVYQAVMAPEYSAAVETLQISPTSKLAGPAAEEGVIARIKAWLQRMSDAPAAIDAQLKIASDWADKMIRLSAIFVVQTIVLPLAFLWIFWRVCRFALHELATAGVTRRDEVHA